MRENIGLYRGKRKDNGEWVVGYLTVSGDDDVTLVIDYFARTVQCYCQTDVDPETVGECSGVPDKDGVNIYEGDILKITYLCQKPVTAIVEFADGKFTARYTRSGKEHIDNLSETVSDLYKILGTIHDNPELLTQKNI